MAKDRSKALEQQGITKLTRIVLDAREDKFIFGTKDMKEFVNSLEDKYAKVNTEPREELSRMIQVNTSGVIISMDPLQTTEPDIQLAAMGLFLNQLSLRSIMDKLELSELSGSMSKVMDGIIKLGQRKRGSVAQSEGKVGDNKPGPGKGPTFGGV